jgi:hypothetical protein
MLVETNPWLLVLTFAVSILHSVFDFLAFKNGTHARTQGRGGLCAGRAARAADVADF